MYEKFFFIKINFCTNSNFGEDNFAQEDIYHERVAKIVKLAQVTIIHENIKMKHKLSTKGKCLDRKTDEK